jgi:thiosulfate dehydrogenase (quinone) large subunit
MKPSQKYMMGRRSWRLYHSGMSRQIAAVAIAVGPVCRAFAELLLKRGDMQISELNQTIDRQLAYGLLRLILGTNILIHGVSRLYMGVGDFARALVPLFEKTPLPPGAVYAYASALPVVEAVLGLCVLLGFESRYAYVCGLLLIASLTFGAALRQDWDSAGLQLIYALLYAILLANREYNVFSADGWMAALQGRGNL